VCTGKAGYGKTTNFTLENKWQHAACVGNRLASLYWLKRFCNSSIGNTVSELPLWFSFLHFTSNYLHELPISVPHR
jgi:hypothetical protein